jgi:glucose-1-phosphate thymidylyltransferase
LGANRYLLTADPPSPAQRPGSVIIPPSFVSRSAEIENAVIGPHASIGAGARVTDCVVRDSIVEDGATVRGMVLEHSVIGRGANVEGRPVALNVADASAVRA